MHLRSIYEIPSAYSYLFSKDSVVSLQSSHIISSLIDEIYERISWINFAQTCKYVYVNNRPLLLEDLQQLENLPDDEKVHLLGIASMNASGYVREAAIQSLEKLDNPKIIPYLLMRLNDWVPTIREKSLNIFVIL